MATGLELFEVVFLPGHLGVALTLPRQAILDGARTEVGPVVPVVETRASGVVADQGFCSLNSTAPI